ncbi:MAG: MMPL family transporter [Bacteroidetes bacterium]|nr:MMPL family transporter [Bacteroidota bacterium]
MITSIMIYFASGLRVHHNLEDFFPKGDEDIAFIQQFEERLEADDNFLIIAIHDTNGILNKPLLAEIHRLTLACDTIKNVVQAHSLTTLHYFIKTPMGFIRIPFLHYDKPEKYSNDSVRIVKDELLAGRFLSDDFKTISVVLKMDSSLSQDDAEILNRSIFNVIDKFSFKQVHVAGKVNTQVVFVQKIEEELQVYVLLSGILVTLVLIIIYGRFWSVFIAVVSVLMGMANFFGILGIIGEPLNLMSSLFPTLMLVVGMSDVIHIMSKYIDELDRQESKIAAMKVTLKQIGWATFLTSLTTAIGFSALLTSRIAPIREFGITSAMGVFVAYITVIVFTTSVLILFRKDQLIRVNRSGGLWEPWMLRIYTFVGPNTNKILIAGLIVFLISLFGASKIPTNTYLLTDFPDNAQPKRDFKFIEQHLAGVRSFEMAAIATDGHYINDLDVLKQIEKVSDYINSRPQLAVAYAPTVIYKNLNRTFQGGSQKEYKLPDDQKSIDKYDTFLEKYSNVYKLNVLISKDKKYGRLTAKMQDIGSDKNKVLNEEIYQWISENIDESLVSFKITGKALLVDKNNEYLRTGLMYGLGLAFLVVSIIMAILFRSIKMMFISMIPNIIPILITGAFMGLAGIELKSSTSMIFTVAFGIAVDDTIHYLSKLKLLLATGMDLDQAIKGTYTETGKAICLTTITLVFGFLILLYSDFNGTVYIGLLVSITLVTALICDLFILPACLYKFLDDPANKS